MYIVKIHNGERETTIHGRSDKLKTGNVVKGINQIDSFSFSMFSSNRGFNLINDRKTLVSVFNANRNRYEFFGRVLYADDTMEESGMITKDVTCESFLGFFCDSIQDYITERNWTVNELIQHIINVHNSKVEEYKHFRVGEVTVTDPNDNLYIGIQRETTWKTIQEKLIGKLGGEIRLRVENGVNYIDYLTEIGEKRSTKIALSHNMKKITREKDSTAYITRLEPYGTKLTVEQTTTDDDGNTTTQAVQTEERLDISSVNGGLKYVVDEEAEAAFGIIVGTVNFDDVTDPYNLMQKGKAYLAENNRMLVKYSITALDLSLLGIDIDDFDVCNSHPIENRLMNISDTVRIIKKNIDVVNEHASTMEVGDNFKSLTEIQLEQANRMTTMTQTVGKIESNYVTNEKLTAESAATSSMISQATDAIMLSVEDSFASKKGMEELEELVQSELTVLAEEITAKFSTTTKQVEEVDGEMQSKFEELYKYITMSDNGITIRSSDSTISLSLDNENGIIFSRNGVEFGRWDGDNFYTGNIHIRVDEIARFGNFAFKPRSDGSLSFLKVGE
jgi:phage minor structural protein